MQIVRAMEEIQVDSWDQPYEHAIFLCVAAAEQSETSGDIARNIEDINHIADKSYQAMSSIAEASQPNDWQISKVIWLSISSS